MKIPVEWLRGPCDGEVTEESFDSLPDIGDVVEVLNERHRVISRYEVVKRIYHADNTERFNGWRLVVKLSRVDRYKGVDSGTV